MRVECARMDRQTIALLIVTVLMASGCQAAPPQSLLGKSRTLFEVVDELLRDGISDRSKIEQVVGGTFTLQSSVGFEAYVAQRIALNDVTVEALDYRRSIPGNEQAGPYLAMTGIGNCIAAGDVSRHYGALELSGVPSPHARAGETFYSKREPWGTLSFGFETKSTECLRSVIFDARGSNPP